MPKTTATCLGDIRDASLRTLAGWRCFGSAALAIGTTPAKVKTTVAVDYSIDGVMYHKAITDDLFVHTDLTVQAADTTKYYALCLDKTGAASIIQGSVNFSAGGTTFAAPLNLPVIPATKCCIGAIKVVTVAVTFTPATDSHAKSGCTTTYYNLSAVPTSGLPA